MRRLGICGLASFGCEVHDANPSTFPKALRATALATFPTPLTHVTHSHIGMQNLQVVDLGDVVKGARIAHGGTGSLAVGNSS